jgi:hypothetical protein
MSGDPPSKREQLLKLLERGSVFVHLDPRRESVVVPDWLARKPQLVLQLGLNFAIPIPDLEVDEYGVRCTLSFNRSPFHCTLPWVAIYALVAEDGQVTVWPTELPIELVPQPAAVRRNQPVPRSSRGRSQPPPRPRISVVPPPLEGESDDRPSSLFPTSADSLAPPPAPEFDTSPSGSKGARANDGLSMRPAPPTPSQPPPADGKKPARERPPYLRLIK